MIAQLVENPPAMQETPVQFLGWEDPLEKGQATHFSSLDFPCGSAAKESTLNAGDLGSVPRLRRSPGEGKGYPLHYSGLENSTECVIHGVTKSWTRLSDFHFSSLLMCVCVCVCVCVYRERERYVYVYTEIITTLSGSYTSLKNKVQLDQ